MHLDSALGTNRPIPSLDGLRAISIGTVVLSHAAQARRIGFSYDIFAPHEVGKIGVRLFFVISGLLITSLLLAEKRSTGHIDLRRFYVRRAFRIFPAYYVYLAFVAVVASLYPQWFAISWHAFRADLFYLANWVIFPGNPLLHLWSLSMEEQFYLLWPAALFFLGAFRCTPALISVLIIGPLIRAMIIAGVPKVWHLSALLGGSEFLAVGCLLAIYGGQLRQHSWYTRTRAIAAAMSIPVAVILTAVDETAIFAYVGYGIQAAVYALTVDWCISHPDGWIGRLLNLTVVRYIGVLSYSMYLWHWVFLNAPFPSSPLVWLPLVFGSAMASYHGIERPFLRIRAHVARARVAPKRAAALVSQPS